MTDMVTTMSDAHVAVAKALERHGYGIMEEVEFPPYRVDVYLPEYHAAVEVDGVQHGPTADARRDRRLDEDYSLPVFHIRAGDSRRPALWMPLLALFLKQAASSKDDRWESCKMRTPWL